jgi:hypothetical protein
MVQPVSSNTVKSKKLKRDISDFLVDDDIEKALITLREGLKATKVNRYRDPKNPRGIQYGDKPDHTVRFHSAKLLLEYGFGKPATRAEISITDESKKSASPDEIIKKIQNSAHSFKEIADTYVHSLPNADLSEHEDE